MDTDFVREICLSMPAATEEIKWGNDLVFSVGGKMFCVMDLNPPFRCSFKVKDEAYEELSVTPGFVPAPYMARAKWVQVQHPAVLHRDEWIRYLEGSYELVKSKLTRKARQQLGI